jgi:hypothetical protein
MKHTQLANGMKRRQKMEEGMKEFILLKMRE